MDQGDTLCDQLLAIEPRTIARKIVDPGNLKRVALLEKGFCQGGPNKAAGAGDKNLQGFRFGRYSGN